MKLYLLLIFCFVNSLVNAQQTDEDLSTSSQVTNQLKIGTYNIFAFGRHSKYPQAYNCARIIAQCKFDILAIQEVMSKNGEQELNRVVTYLKDSFNVKYSYFISDEIGYGLGDKERIGFIYNNAVIKPLKYKGRQVNLYEHNLGKGRNFAFAKFQKDDFDFTVLSCHILWGPTTSKSDKEYTMKRRLNEVGHIKKLLDNPMKYFEDDDLIVVGDFNRCGRIEDFKSYGFNQDSIMMVNVDPFDPTNVAFCEVPENVEDGNSGIFLERDQLSTTVSNETFHVYDLIILSHSLMDNYPVKRGEALYGIHYGVECFDRLDYVLQGSSMCPEIEQYSETLKRHYSDHRPVWVILNY